MIYIEKMFILIDLFLKVLFFKGKMMTEGKISLEMKKGQRSCLFGNLRIGLHRMDLC